MAIGQDLAIWKERWNALGEPMERLKAGGFAPLVERLERFAEAHFNYFCVGFSPGGSLTKDNRWPAEHVLSVILDQVADDLAVIGRIADQHQGTSNTTLELADFLIRQALAPALELVREALELHPGEDIDRAVVFTYFQKMAAIRVVPYASVPLIAVPFTCTKSRRDLLAIPHEVGHYVYWNGRVDRGKKRLRVALAEVLDSARRSPPWLDSWVEELFADIYGCMVAGPLIALDFQDLQLQTSDESFVSDDGEHPTPVLRPYVYNKVLERQTEWWASSLNSLWEWRIKEKRGNPSHVVIGEPIPLNIGREQMSDQVEKIHGFLRATGLKSDCWWQERWPKERSYRVQDASNLENESQCLYDSFDKAVETEMNKTAGVDFDVFSSTERPQLESKAIDYEAWQAALPQPEEGELPWLNVFGAEGWATKGPHTRK